MWTWLAKIDPNTVIAIAVALGTYAYHLIRQDNHQSFRDSLVGLGNQVLHDVLADPALVKASIDQARQLVTDSLWKLADRAGIPRNAATEALAQPIIEHAISALLDQLKQRDALAKLPDGMSQLAISTQAIADVFKNPPKLSELAAKEKG